MFSDKEMEKLVVSVSGNKVAVTPDLHDFSHLAGNLPPEAAALLAMMQGHSASPVPSAKNSAEEEAMKIFAQMESLDSVLNSISNEPKKISDTNPDLRSIVERELNYRQALDKEVEQIIENKNIEADSLTTTFINRLSPEISGMLKAARAANNNPSETSQSQLSEAIQAVETPVPAVLQQPSTLPQEMVRARSVEMQVAYERQKALDEIRNATDFRKKLTIYECGVALGIIVGSSTRNEVAEIMKEFSKIICPDDNDLMFFYSDIQITVFYNDDMVVRELQFGDYYKGQTSSGLQLGDPLEKAFELYGQPRMKSPRGAIWNKFGIFCQNNCVSSIRIQA